MVLYDLAYPYKTEEEDDDVLVIPVLLTEQQPERNMESAFPVSNSLYMRYKAETDLPPDTISRFIVFHHTKIMLKDGKQIVWRKGVKLHDKKGNIALVKEIDREIRLYVKGSNAKEFLSELRGSLNEIFKKYKSKYPTLEYKIAVTEDNEIIYADDGTIIGYMINKKLYFEPKTGGDIIMAEVVKKYNIKVDSGNVAFDNGIVKSITDSNGAKMDTNDFNFYDCNIELQGIVSDLEEAEKLEAKREVIIKSGFLGRLCNLIEELKDENSQTYKVINRIKMVSKLFKKYLQDTFVCYHAFSVP